MTSSLGVGILPDEIGLSKFPVSNSEIKASGKRGSAVLMLFCSSESNQENAPSHLVFIRRSTSVRTHKGQISFPGGRSEPEDSSPEQTALRETAEEIGIDSGNIIVCGQLPVATALDGSLIVPIVGIFKDAERVFKPDFSEVDYVFTAPWTNFCKTSSVPFNFNLFGNWRASHLFEADIHRIWGLTAAILHSADLG